ncbi:hypothetical protein ORV05_03715 [Amycolatopsis cynarae]|uniref:Uncharacterized protein n=1 Tax=Amycolatopsis cynarae TaxID=2995223 RepID=A0ABY7B5I7_9PSEU|nr:hypothetical protein [Amycolatopsis sp. HUAS 11-8]WAL66918.1 hypothetical protein ORV05_03715 [Amycolatopsis sp. HUAS 11-8]
MVLGVQPAGEPHPRAGVPVHVAELGGVGGHGVECGEQGDPVAARERAEPGGGFERGVTAGERAGEPEHVGDGVHQDGLAVDEPNPVDQSPHLAHGDAFGLGAVRAPLSEDFQQAHVVLGKRHGGCRELQVRTVGLVVESAAEVQHGDPVPRGMDQLLVHGQHLRVGVLVAPVLRQVQQVDGAKTGEVHRHPLGGGRIGGERLGDAGKPEGQGVGHAVRELLEIHVVLDVVAHEFPHRGEHLRPRVDHCLGRQARKVLE